MADNLVLEGSLTASTVHGTLDAVHVQNVQSIFETTTPNLNVSVATRPDNSETLQLGMSEHLIATTFTGNGSQLTNLNADALASGTLSCGLFPRNLELQGSLAVKENVFIQGALFCSDVRLYGTSDMPVPPSCSDTQGSGGGGTGTQLTVTTLQAENVFAANSIAIGGTVAPIAPLHIGGSVAFEEPGFLAYIRPDADIGVVTGVEEFTNLDMAVYAEGAVVATVFAGLSDSRVKTDVESAESMLSVVDSVRPVTYRYRDHVHHGSSKRLGVIAQDLQKVLPECVAQHSGPVPNVWKTAVAQRSSDDPSSTCVTFEANECVDPRLLSKGKIVRLITSNPLPGVRDVRITRGLSSDQGLGFNVDLEDVYGDVFVYGTLESDVLTVEYDGLAVAACGAVRELHEKVRALEAMVHELTTHLSI
jgi:hypothetical protein